MWVLGVGAAWAAPVVSDSRRVELAVGGGAASYAPFQFWTVGGEVRVRPFSGLRVVAGADAWATNRIPPPDVQLDSGVYSVWNWVQPLHAGAIFQLDVGPLEPYAGADVIVVNHTAGEWTAGGRARLGADWFFVKPVGVGLDVAVGGWSGKGWEDLAPGARDAGLVAQGSLQVVAGF
jgi:hypothetical protein